MIDCTNSLLSKLIIRLTSSSKLITKYSANGINTELEIFSWVDKIGKHLKLVRILDIIFIKFRKEPSSNLLKNNNFPSSK